MPGPPSEFTQETADAICEGLIEGESLRTICARPEMPSKSTVMVWLVRFPEFAAQYAEARTAQAEAIFDEMLEIADEGEPNADMNGRDRLRIDARKWVLGKLAPKKYGDKLELSGKVAVSHEDALAALR